MKIDYHSLEFALSASMIFFDKINKFAEKTSVYDSKIKKSNFTVHFLNMVGIIRLKMTLRFIIRLH